MAPPSRTVQVRTRLLLINLVSNYGAKLFVLTIGFILTPVILHRIGAADFGLWALAGSLVGYGSLLDLGIAGGIIKYGAEYEARGDWDALQELVATALLLYAAIGVLALLLTLVATLTFPILFHVSTANTYSARWLVLLMGLTLSIGFPAGVPSAILRGLQRFDLVNLLSSVATLISAVATVAVLWLGGGLVGMVAIGVPLTIIMQIPAVWFVRSAAPRLHLNWHTASWHEARRLFTFSLSLFAIQIGGQLQTKTDLLVIARFLPLTAVTPYAIALRLADIPQILTDQFLKLLLPMSSGLHASNDWDQLRAVYVTSTRLTLSLFLPVALPLMFLADSIITVWVGQAYASSAHLVIVLTLAGLIVTSQWPAGAILQGMAHHRLLAYSTVATGVANLVLSVILVHPFGVMGVALGTLVPTAAECLGFVLPYAARTLGVSMGEIMREIVLPAGLPALPTIAVLLGLRVVSPLDSLVPIIVIGAAAFAIHVTCYVTLGARGSERDAYFSAATTTLRMARERLF